MSSARSMQTVLSVPLAIQSQLLTTFLTDAIWESCFKKLPFGISGGPELFQRRISKILQGLQGVTCHMDDVLIFGNNKDEYNQCLLAVLDRVQTVRVTLNRDKCELGKPV